MGRMMDRKHVISGLFWLAVSIFVAVMAIDLGLGTFSSPGSGFIFFWSSVGLGALSVILILKSILGKGEANPFMDLWKGLKWGNAVLAIVMLLLYALILTKLGFMLSTFMLMIVLFGIGRSSISGCHLKCIDHHDSEFYHLPLFPGGSPPERNHRVVGWRRHREESSVGHPQQSVLWLFDSTST